MVEGLPARRSSQACGAGARKRTRSVNIAECVEHEEGRKICGRGRRCERGKIERAAMMMADGEERLLAC